MEQDIKNILGYGEKLSILVGKYSKDEGLHKAGDDMIKEYHVCPVSISQLGELYEYLNIFMANPNMESKETIEAAIKIIKLSLAKMHPDITEDEIVNNFGQVSIAKVVEIASEINDFLSLMRGTMNKFQEVAQKQKQILMKK